MIYKLFY